MDKKKISTRHRSTISIRSRGITVGTQEQDGLRGKGAEWMPCRTRARMQDHVRGNGKRVLVTLNGDRDPTGKGALLRKKSPRKGAPQRMSNSGLRGKYTHTALGKVAAPSKSINRRKRSTWAGLRTSRM